MRSALDDIPRPGAQQRVLVSLGAAGTALAASAAAKGAAAAGTAAGQVGAAGTAGVAGAAGVGAGTAVKTAVTTTVIFKWIGIGVVAGGVATGTAVGVSKLTGEPATAPALSASAVSVDATPAPGQPRPHAAGRSQLNPAAEEPVEAPAPNAARFAAPAESPSGLASEISLLDRARSALDGGDTNAALAALDEHGAKYDTGALAEEAELLRLEALVQRGQTAAALGQGRAFLAAHPRSPHTGRVRRLMQRARGSSPSVATFPEEER
jgi:hypothetical protein